MNTVELICNHCGEMYAYPKYELSAHLGKKAKIKCKHCDERNFVNIDLPLLSGEKESHTNIHHEETKERSLHVMKLVVQDSGQDKSFTLDLLEGISILGRKYEGEAENKVHVTQTDKTVSRDHCQVEKVIENNAVNYVIKDLGSTNGTFINNEQITEEEEVYLMPGDTIKLGNIEIEAS